MSSLARLSRLLLVLAAVAATSALQAQPVRPAFPQLQLPEARAQGQRAIDLLGNRLPEVAAFYRKTPEQFRQMMLSDRMFRLDRRGRVFIEEEMQRPQGVTSFASPSNLVAGTLAPLDQTFLLHSRPGAKRTIYLNFRGATLSNTAWNGSSGTLTALPYDIDGIPYSFSDEELRRIQYMWQRVAEDFAPFDVDVTTEAPQASQLTRSGSSDDVYGTTALITSRSGVYSCSCGGVAYLGVFDDTSDFYKPALVFYDALGGDERNIAEAISHEVGHNGGLRHDGTATTGYYTGQGSGATGWAPIMGVGYYQPLVQWSKGEYAGANNTEDDFAVMQANGLPLRADDHGDTIGAATPMTGTVSGGTLALAAQGVIERAGDTDAFAFTAGAGTLTLTLSPAARSANLDAMIELRDASDRPLAAANPADALGATITFTLPAAGTYYVLVHGVGKGDPAVTGYSDYGSLGQYSLSGSATAPGGSAPVASVTANPLRGPVPLTVNFDGRGSSDADGSITTYDWTFGDGTSASGATATRTYGTAGSFTATLRVTDNSGLSSTRSVTITVDPVVATVPMRVTDIAMSLVTQRTGRTRANAVVTVRDGNGNPVNGATVTGSWSGIVSGTGSALSGSSGSATFGSPNLRTTGTVTFTVTGITLSGYQYQPATNVETSDSITR